MSSTHSLQFPSATGDAVRRNDGADEVFSLPDWLYRSEAFAEDLGGCELQAMPAPAQRPSWRLSSAVLYLATLGLALAASVPTALIA